MKDLMKNLLTHGAAAGGGYYLGKRNSTSKIIHNTMFSRFIPTVIFAAGIAYFASKIPGTVESTLNTSSNNGLKIELEKNSTEYKLKDKALDKGFDVYGTKNLEYDALKEDYSSFKSKVESETQSIINERNALRDINEQQGERLQNIEGKLDSVLSNKKNSIDEHVQNNTRVNSNYGARKMTDDVKRKTMIYRNVYIDPFGRPYIVEKRRVKRNYN